MRYLLSKKFTKIGRTSGTVQNTSQTCTLEMSETNEPDTGILIPPLRKHSFQNTTIYLRCVDGWAEAGVLPFSLDTDGSSGSSSPSSTVDDSQVATDEEIGELIDNIFGDDDSGSTVDDAQVATDEEIDELLDNIFG